MVSTRRGAQTAPEQDMSAPPEHLSLRKKPVRKATAAKTAAAKPSTEAPKKRPGRPKKIVEEPAQEEEVIEDEEAKPKTVKPARTTRATGTRGKQEPQEEDESRPAETEAKPTRKSTTRKTRVEVQPDPPLAKATEPATRATRATRATTTKSAPLSPKKITQISKASTRTGKNQNDKQETAKNLRSQPTTRTRGKRRAVSNENEEVELAPTAAAEPSDTESEENEKVATNNSPACTDAAQRFRSTIEKHNEGGDTISSRPSTPGASPAPSSNAQKDHENSQPNTPSVADSEAEREEEDANESEDELCGPKTPMKRSSPGAERRYLSSVQRTVRRIESEARLETPDFRTTAQAKRAGTPQTQKAYTKPAVPNSAARPMTVARGSDRAFVFRPLGRGPVDARNEQQLPATEEEDTISYIASPPAMREEVENFASSPVPSQPVNLIGADNDESQLGEAPSFHDHSFADSESIVQPSTALVADSEDSLQKADNNASSDNVEEVHDLNAAGTESTKHQDDETMLSDADDPNETILIHQAASPRPLAQEQTESDLDESAIIDDDFAEPTGLLESVPKPVQHGTIQEEDDSFTGEDTEIEPQTIDWQNIREDVTIPVNFDWHLTGVGQQQLEREAAEVEEAQVPTRQDDAIDPSTGFLKDRSAEAILDLEPAAAEEAFDELEQTLNMSEFLDVNALAEPTARLSITLQDGSGGDQASSVDISLCSHSDEASRELPAAADEAKPEHADGAGESADVDISSEENVAGSPASAALSRQASEIDISFSTPERTETLCEDTLQPDTPHYALPTISFDARRKSLPAFLHKTPTGTGTRPHTSDGASIARLANPFVRSERRGQTTTVTPQSSPSVKRSATSYGGYGSVERKPVVATALHASPGARRKSMLPHAPGLAARKSSVVTTPNSAHKTSIARNSQPAQSPASAKSSTPVDPTPTKTPGERYPKSAKRGAMYGEPGNGEAGSTPQQDMPGTTPEPQPTPQATPRERYPRSVRQSQFGMTPAKQVHSTAYNQVSPRKTPQTTPKSRVRASASPTKTTPAPMAATPSPAKVTPPTAEAARSPPQETPQSDVVDRFPRMNRQSYVSHATTVAAPSRFRTPSKSPMKRPATAHKPTSLRKVALKASVETPMKTPLKPAAETPGANIPMTPHPSAPLRGVLALVEIFTLEGASASSPFIVLLHRLGAKTTKVWRDGITHVIFKDGSPTTLQRVRLHNKNAGDGKVIHCVSSRWVSDCDAEGAHVGEEDEKYAVDVEEVPRGGKRRRKSMEPNALVNVNGNVVKNRKSSLGRSSLGKSAVRFMEPSPVKQGGADDESEVTEGDETPKAQVGDEGKENWGDSPITPDWIGAPEKLVQQTAPMNRVRKLELKGEKGGNRRLTFWKGA
ncbi:hypothetical protein MBLNU230_g2425t1 [Neophaeotheca triangularis]